MSKIYFTLLAAVLYVNLPSSAVAQHNEMRVHVINVGQGSATLIEFPCGVILVDTGGEANTEFHSTEALTTYLDDFFHKRTDLNNTIDLLMISHPHIDHTRGIKEVLGRYTVKNAITNGQTSGKGPGYPGQKFLHHEISKREGTVSTTDDIKFFESLENKIPSGGLTNAVIDPINCVGADPVIRLLWGQVPNSYGWTAIQFDDENNHSVVCKIDFGQSSLIMTGDLEEVAIASLLRKHADKSVFDSDVYLVGHHGSKNGTTVKFLQAVTPEIAILSFGDPQRKYTSTAWAHGHPNKAIIQMLISNVSGSRNPIMALMGTGAKKFDSQTISKALYGVGWDDTILLTANLNGQWSAGPSVDNRLNINVATLAQLQTLPTIGLARAQAIIAHRSIQKFKSIEELDNVPGIGPATVTILRPLVKI